MDPMISTRPFASTTSATTMDASGTVWRAWTGCEMSASVTMSDEAWTAWTGSGIVSIDPWAPWNGIVVSIAMTGTGDPWATWNVTFSPDVVGDAIRLGMERARNPELDAAHRRQREADRLVYQTRLRQERAKRVAAEARAEKLLMSILSSAQQAQYQAERRFTVHLPNGHRYMVRKGRHGNIERIDETGKALENLCVHVAPHEIPDFDNMAAQKLLLESCEEELRGIANITRIGA